MTRRRPKVQSHRLLRYGPNLPKQGVIDWPLDRAHHPTNDNHPADQQPPPHRNSDDTNSDDTT